MYIRISATAYASGLQGSDTQISIIQSNIPWLPSVQKLLIEPTNDSIHLNAAITKINNVGSSQIHDAVYQAAEQIITYQTDNPEWENAHKVILLLTDGDENLSQHSLNQATDRVNFINGGMFLFQFVPIRLGFFL